MPKTKKQRQKLYKMKGCYKKKSKKHLSVKKHLGGSNYNLAYTGKPIFSVPNPNLAYTNTNAENTVYPNTGPIATAQNWLNSSIQKGGCGEGGGTCPLLKGGSSNDLQGQSWGADFKWPGTNHVSGDYNHYALNKYEPVDISRQMIATGAQPPFLGGAKKNKNKKNKSKKQKGGAFSNFLTQDLVNVGRQLQFGLGTAYNGIKGYEAPISPMPWQQPYLSKSISKY
jgi:hypothetical protein